MTRSTYAIEGGGAARLRSARMYVERWARGFAEGHVGGASKERDACASAGTSAWVVRGGVVKKLWVREPGAGPASSEGPWAFGKG